MTAVLWFLPALRWVLGELRLAREQVVDAEVVARTGGRRAYAETLVALAAPTPVPALAASLFTSPLERRIELLLEEGAMSKKAMAAALAACATVVGLVAVTAVHAVPLQAVAASKAASDEDDVRDGGPTGGVPGGIPGGVTGGVPGGVKGGVGGGVPGGVAGEKKERQAERKLIHKVSPTYPPEAKTKGVEGIVQLDVLITAAGDVTDVKVKKGPSELTEAAASAVRQWKYEPGDRDTRATLTIHYRLDKKKTQ